MVAPFHSKLLYQVTFYEKAMHSRNTPIRFKALQLFFGFWTQTSMAMSDL